MPMPKFIPLKDYRKFTEKEMLIRSRKFYQEMNRRRTVRSFSSKVFPIDILENCILTAGTAPSGANKQPWHFAVVSNPEVKKKIRSAAEAEEREFYSTRAPKEWLTALEQFGTNAQKPFLETAPYLIAVFAKGYEVLPDRTKLKNYYAQESVGIACGLLIAAIHNAGLASLTHTPSPMNFLNKILDRPANERPYLLIIVGYPEEKVLVPDIERKKLSEVTTFL